MLLQILLLKGSKYVECIIGSRNIVMRYFTYFSNNRIKETTAQNIQLMHNRTIINRKLKGELNESQGGLSVFSTRLHVHQRMNANGNWHQMIYFPETRIQ
jgi:hypothetical protein